MPGSGPETRSGSRMSIPDPTRPKFSGSTNVLQLTVLGSRSRRAENKLSPGAGAKITNYDAGSGSGSLLTNFLILYLINTCTKKRFFLKIQIFFKFYYFNPIRVKHAPIHLRKYSGQRRQFSRYHLKLSGAGAVIFGFNAPRSRSRKK